MKLTIEVLERPDGGYAIILSAPDGREDVHLVDESVEDKYQAASEAITSFIDHPSQKPVRRTVGIDSDTISSMLDRAAGTDQKVRLTYSPVFSFEAQAELIVQVMYREPVDKYNPEDVYYRVNVLGNPTVAQRSVYLPNISRAEYI